MFTIPHPYDLIIGLDRSDQKADLGLIDTHTGQQTQQTVDTSPESLQHWLTQLRAQYPQARVGLILEQPALNLIGFLESVDWITLYAINPITLQKFREAFVTSRAKDDAKDAQYLAELLFTHHPKLKPWLPEDSQTRLLQQLVRHRRAVVDERTGLSNRLKALLKQYFSQALHLCGKELWRPLATLGSQRQRFPAHRHLQQCSGIAPVTKQSGNKRHVHRRYLCSKFQRQGWHEYAKESVLWCRWPAAYYWQQRENGSSHNTAVRSLAYKWQ
jgi:transposase